MGSADRLRKKVQRTIEKYRMLSPRERVVVAVSGGVDSTVLLHLLHDLSGGEGYSLHVAHLNHGLRGAESQRDAEFVRDLAAGFGLEATIGSAAGKQLWGDASVSLQVRARRARYAFLEETARGLGASKIALGHTKDDQAETILINFLRGAGRPGLRGIPPVREGRFVRPLIEVSRREVEEYARAHQISFMTDSSNLRGCYLRNRVRLHLLPLLREQYNPQLTDTLASMASLLADEEELMQSLTSARLPAVLVERVEGAVTLSIAHLLREPVALRRRILMEAAQLASPPAVRWGHRHILSLEGLLWAASGSQLALPAGITGRRDYDRLEIACREQSPPLRWEYPLQSDGLTRIPEIGLSIRVETKGRTQVALRKDSPQRVLLDADETLLPLLLRNRRRGDCFYPLGLGGKKKLKDFFIDAKVSRPRRDEIPLLLCGGEIAWVVGWRIDDRYRVSDRTSRVLVVEVTRDEDG